METSPEITYLASLAKLVDAGTGTVFKIVLLVAGHLNIWPNRMLILPLYSNKTPFLSLFLVE
jgi:hypothetical protein